jgi:hypothetical protein
MGLLCNFPGTFIWKDSAEKDKLQLSQYLRIYNAYGKIGRSLREVLTRNLADITE